MIKLTIILLNIIIINKMRYYTEYVNYTDNESICNIEERYNDYFAPFILN